MMFDYLVIKIDAPWKGVFDIILTIASCYNVFTNAYYSAYRMPNS